MIFTDGSVYFLGNATAAVSGALSLPRRHPIADWPQGNHLDLILLSLAVIFSDTSFFFFSI